MELPEKRIQKHKLFQNFQENTTERDLFLPIFPVLYLNIHHARFLYKRTERFSETSHFHKV